MKKIYFEPTEKHFPGLMRAKDFVPEWYRKGERFVGKTPTFLPNNNSTIKTCVPFLDAMTSGYIIPLAVDILVEERDNKPFFSWRTDDRPYLTVREPRLLQGLPIPDGFEDLYPTWETQLSLEWPVGYSALITHPLNHYDLPFLTLSGVVDSYKMPGGSLPFFLKKGFTGMIPQGTPIAQVFPFKSEAWKMEESLGLTAQSKIGFRQSTSIHNGWYKKYVWKKKSFE